MMSLFDLEFLGFEKRAEKEQEGGGGSSGWKALPKKTRGYLSILANLFVKYIDETEEQSFDSEKSDEKVLFSTKLSQLYDEGKKGPAKKLVAQQRAKHKVMIKKKVTVKDDQGNDIEVEKRVWNPSSKYFAWFKTNAAKHVEGKAKKSVKELVEQVKQEKKENSKPKAEKPKEQEEEKSQPEKEKPKGKTQSEKLKERRERKEQEEGKGKTQSQENTQSTSSRGAPKTIKPTKGAPQTKKKKKANAYVDDSNLFALFAVSNLISHKYGFVTEVQQTSSSNYHILHVFGPQHTWVRNNPLFSPIKIAIGVRDNEIETVTSSMEVLSKGLVLRNTRFSSAEQLKKILLALFAKKGFKELLKEFSKKLASSSNLLAYAQHSQNPVKFLVKLATTLPKKEAKKALRQASKIASTAKLLKTLRDEFSHVNKIDPRDPAYLRVKELLRKLTDDQLEMIISENIKFVSRLASTILLSRQN